MKTYINLGCGRRYNSEWTNFDLHATGPDVIAIDLRNGIPLPSESCDVVYNSALLEHIRREHVSAFLKECFRVLKPCGIIRIGVPDLERICELYLIKLRQVMNGDRSSENDYDWMVLELLDQLVREEQGGEMKKFLSQKQIPNLQFIRERIGEEGKEYTNKTSHLQSQTVARSFWLRAVERIKRDINMLRQQCAAQLLTGRERKAVKIGAFRLSGEVHQWMYDRCSLSRLVRAAGFTAVESQTASSSRIPNWPNFQLDVLADGTIIKPDLTFIEGTKQP